MTDEAQVYEGGAKCSVSIWTTARGGPQWRVRLTEEATEELAEIVVARAVRAYGLVEAELAGASRPPFEGEEPAP